MTENSRSGRHLFDGFSLEVSARYIAALANSAEQLVPGTRIFIPWLPGEDDELRLKAACTVRTLGFEPVPHLSARRIASSAELHALIVRMAGEAGVDRCLVIGGDPAQAAGPFVDSLALIDTGFLERAGIKAIGIGGHPDGHPVMDMEGRWRALDQKLQSIAARGMTPSIVTQFSFDAGDVLAWLDELRARGMTCPVELGVPGPTSVATLARYATLCGVRGTASMLSKYGVSLGKLLGTAGPDVFITRLLDGLAPRHGDVGLHFFPFGGVAKSIQWIDEYQRKIHALQGRSW